MFQISDARGGMVHESTTRPSYSHAPKRTPKICSSSEHSTQEEKESCQTRDFVHGMPVSNVTTIPTATTEVQERNVHAAPLRCHREPTEVCKCSTREAWRKKCQRRARQIQCQWVGTKTSSKTKTSPRPDHQTCSTRYVETECGANSKTTVGAMAHWRKAMVPRRRRQ